MESVLALSYVLFILGAASNSHPATPAKPAAAVSPVTACRAVPRAEVELALGERVGPGQEAGNGAESTCDYATTKGLVSVTLRRSGQKLNLEAEVAALAAAIPEGALRKTTTLETPAYIMEIPGAGAQLHVVRQEREYLFISVLGLAAPPQAAAIAEHIARRALPVI